MRWERPQEKGKVAVHVWSVSLGTLLNIMWKHQVRSVITPGKNVAVLSRFGIAYLPSESK